MNVFVPDPATLTPGARRILDAASELFYQRGITSVGVDLVAEHSGVTKRTLYNSFGSKDALVSAYLLDRDRRWRRLVEHAVAAPGASARERVLAPFDALCEWTTGNPRGCGFVNALAELPDPAHPGHRIAAESKRWLRSLFERLATDAGLDAPADLAMRLMYLHEGALALQTALPECDHAAIARRAARDLVEPPEPTGGP